MRKVLAVLVLAVALASLGTIVHSATSALDGSTWSVKLTPDASSAEKGEKPFKDDLAFENGQVTMSACAKSGFAPSGYSASTEGSAWSFDTKQISPDQGETAWTGNISGDSITGSMVWTKKDGAIINYNYEGKKASSSGSS